MPLQIACSFCSAKIKVKDDLIGKQIKCPKCSKIFKATAEDKKSEAKLAAASTAKKPPASWEDDEDTDDKSSPWDKKKTAKDEEKQAKKPVKKAKTDDDDDDRAESKFKELLAQTALPDTTKKLIQDELGLREFGVWVGQPDATIMTVRAIPKALIGLFFAAFFGIAGSIVLGIQLNNFAYIAIPALILVLLMIAIVVGGLVLFMDRRKALATAYVVTNKRCIVFTGKWFSGPAQESFYPDLLQHMRRMGSWIFGGDAGDLVFRSVTTITTTHHSRGGTSTSVSTTYYGFLGIRELDQIETLVRQTLLMDDDDDDDENEKPKKKKKKRTDDDDDD